MHIDIEQALAKLSLLQKRMGIEEPPDIDWSAFSSDGIDVEIDEIAANVEGLLTYKGELCILYIREQLSIGATTSNAKYHITECTTIRSMHTQGRGHRYVATNRADGMFSVQQVDRYGDTVGRARFVSMNVCRNCLGNLDWDGYQQQAGTGRTRIYKGFALRSYLEVYTDRRRKRTRRRGARPPEAPPRPDPTTQPPDRTPGWAHGVADADFQAVLAYISKHRFIGEADLIEMLGGAKTGARRARRFARKFQQMTEAVPFSIRTSFHGGQKVYRRA